MATGAWRETRRAAPGRWRAVVAGTVVAVVFLGLAMAVYRWGIPVRQTVGADAALGVPLAVAGAAIGSFLGRPGAHGERRATRIAVGALIAVIGALIAESVGRWEHWCTGRWRSCGCSGLCPAC